MERVERRLIVPAELAGRRLDQAAAALFPVLFIGLAAVTASTWRDAVRAAGAGAGAAVLLIAAPAAGVLGALAAAIAVACVGVRR